MASNVFGTPITDSTLRKMPEYANAITITRKDRATVAHKMKNSEDGKDLNARQYVENLQQNWGADISTLCLIYNATGDTISFVSSKDWEGRIGHAPYPVEIFNGQWGGFLHVKTPESSSGSYGGVAYTGKNNAGDDCGWMISWSNLSDNNNKVYNETRQADHYNENWDDVCTLLRRSGVVYKETWGGCMSTGAIGGDANAVVEAIMMLENA